MQYTWPWKKIHEFFIGISWDFYETAFGSGPIRDFIYRMVTILRFDHMIDENQDYSAIGLHVQYRSEET